MELTNRKVETVLNLIGSLQGTAWKLVEDFNLDDTSQGSAFKDLLKKLDATFQYDSCVHLPNGFDNSFNMSRPAGQALLQHVTTHDELYRKIGEHSVTLPMSVQGGWHMLRRSNLTKDQHQLVMTRPLDWKRIVWTGLSARCTPNKSEVERERKRARLCSP